MRSLRYMPSTWLQTNCASSPLYPACPTVHPHKNVNVSQGVASGQDQGQQGDIFQPTPIGIYLGAWCVAVAPSCIAVRVFVACGRAMTCCALRRGGVCQRICTHFLAHRAPHTYMHAARRRRRVVTVQSLSLCYHLAVCRPRHRDHRRSLTRSV